MVLSGILNKHLDNALHHSLHVYSNAKNTIDNDQNSFNENKAQSIETKLTFIRSKIEPLDAVIIKSIQNLPYVLILKNSQIIDRDEQPKWRVKSDKTQTNPTTTTYWFSTAALATFSSYLPRRSLGLYNLGNTCYLNATLQCLLATRPLVAYIGIKHHRHVPPPSPSNTVCDGGGGGFSTSFGGKGSRWFCALCALKRLIQQGNNNTGLSTSIELASPSQFVANVTAICPSMRSSHQQEDAHEFLLGLLSNMEANSSSAIAPHHQSRDGARQNHKSTSEKKEENAIRQIFGGKLRSEVTCHVCRNTSGQDEAFVNLSLEIGAPGWTLQQCLANFTRREQLFGANAYKCDTCRRLQPASKRFTIQWPPPLILVIQLNRFSRAYKLTHHINLPVAFNLRPFMTTATSSSTSPSNNGAASVLYKLYATVNHEGSSCRSGHYIAYSQRHNNQWYLHNDSAVHSVRQEHVIQQNPYLLFYELINPEQHLTSFASPAPSVSGTSTTDKPDNCSSSQSTIEGRRSADQASHCFNNSSTTAAPINGAATTAGNNSMVTKKPVVKPFDHTSKTSPTCLPSQLLPARDNMQLTAPVLPTASPINHSMLSNPITSPRPDLTILKKQTPGRQLPPPTRQLDDDVLSKRPKHEQAAANSSTSSSPSYDWIPVTQRDLFAAKDQERHRHKHERRKRRRERKRQRRLAESDHGHRHRDKAYNDRHASHHHHHHHNSDWKQRSDCRDRDNDQRSSSSKRQRNY